MPQIKMKDGREIEILDNALPSPKAIVFHHGTPSHASTWAPWFAQCTALGFRAISYSRAGYGTSDRNFGRRVIDVNNDISRILDEKSVSEFVSIGTSGGGPHALANAFEPRNRGVITLASVGKHGVTDLDFLQGMGQENHDEFGAALKGEIVLQDWLNANMADFKNVTGDRIIESFGGLIGDADKQVLTGDFAAESASVFRNSLAVSFDGWIDDDLAFVKEWGFELGDIKVPVKIWQGDQDFMVPFAHSEWLASKISTSELTSIQGHGHLSLVAAYRSEVLAQAARLLS
jgi:pimeloyl-ACP methyl ester carboxylesterase